MKEYKRVSWNFSGIGGIKAAQKMLVTLDLRKIATQHFGVARPRPHDWPEIMYWPEGNEDSWGSVDLEVNDPRLKELREYLKRAGIPSDRELSLVKYSSKDYALAPWLMCTWGTILPSCEDFGQVYNFRKACTTCGAGAVAKPPITTKLSEMGRARFGTCWDGSMVTTIEIAKAIAKAKLTGIRFFPAFSVKKRTPDTRYCHVQIRYTWPRAHFTTVFDYDCVCEVCGRAGHYEPARELTNYQVVRPKRKPPDFGLTWEMFGGPLKRPHKNLRITCGQPSVILSQRARTVIGKAVGSWIGQPIIVLEPSRTP